MIGAFSSWHVPAGRCGRERLAVLPRQQRLRSIWPWSRPAANGRADAAGAGPGLGAEPRCMALRLSVAQSVQGLMQALAQVKARRPWSAAAPRQQIHQASDAR